MWIALVMNCLQAFQEEKVKHFQTRQYRVETGQQCSLELHVFQNNEMELTEWNQVLLHFKEKANACMKAEKVSSIVSQTEAGACVCKAQDLSGHLWHQLFRIYLWRTSLLAITQTHNSLGLASWRAVFLHVWTSLLFVTHKSIIVWGMLAEGLFFPCCTVPFACTICNQYTLVFQGRKWMASCSELCCSPLEFLIFQCLLAQNCKELLNFRVHFPTLGLK